MMNIYYYEGEVIDKEKYLPKYLGWGWNKVAGFSAPYISIQTDDENDVGEHNFIMCFSIPGYDLPKNIGLSPKNLKFLRPEVPFKVKIFSKA